MAELPPQHLEINREFEAGTFTVQKTKKTFSIAIDHAHKQNKAHIKGDGGAVGLTDDLGALRRWMVAGPEAARMIEKFQFGHQYAQMEIDTRHHDQTASV